MAHAVLFTANDMSFSTEKLSELKNRVAELTRLVGTDTPEAIAYSCGNPFNDDDAHALGMEYDMRMGYLDNLAEATDQLNAYLTQYD
jgi:hypothetical protein